MNEFIKLINGTYEDERALVNKTTKEVIMLGDYYHDKIDDKIKGFFNGLDYCKVEYCILENQIINPSQEMFKECEFSDERIIEED